MSLTKQLCTLVAVALLCAPRASFGQSADDARAQAQKLFDEATQALDRRAFDEACPKLEQVLRLQPGKIGAMLVLGECYEGLDKTSSALAVYKQAATAAAAAGDARASSVATKVAELDKAVPRLVIRVAAPISSVPGLVVRSGAEPIDASRWNAPAPVDPGSYVISAAAPGKKTWSMTATPAAGATFEVVIPMLEDVTAAPIAPATGPASAPPPAFAPAPDARDGSGGVPTWAWVAGGVGAASTIAAVVFLVDQGAAQSAFDDECKVAGYDATRCADLSSRLNRDFGLWIGFGSAGLLTLGAATYAIVTAPPRRTAIPPTGRLRVGAPTVLVGEDRAFATIRGAF